MLNLGYGLIGLVGGFLADSQALKADASDFFGDGLITLLGLLAIGWSLTWRARSALLQGVFLGALGLSVRGSTLYRLIVQGHSEAELMDLFGLAALVVNVAAAVVLLPPRTGDANVRAVWLFSRNDALGNLAVVIAAVLVAWTGTAWPDLVVAFVISGCSCTRRGTLSPTRATSCAAPSVGRLTAKDGAPWTTAYSGSSASCSSSWRWTWRRCASVSIPAT